MQLNGQPESSQLTQCSVEEAALVAVLEQIPRAAFVCEQDGTVMRANAAGERLLTDDHACWSETIARAIGGKASDETTAVTRLSVPGHAPHFLIVAKGSGPDRVADAIETARASWGLRAREIQVLAKVAQGRSNRVIAADLGLAERTVELHITGLLRKAGAESRAQLIIALWELADAPSA